MPVFLSDVPVPVRSRRAAARRRPRQCDAAGCPRLLLAGHIGRGDARGDPGRADRHRAVQPGDAADPRRQLHPRRRHRPGRRGRRAALRARGRRPSARSSGGSASTSRSSSRTAPRSSSASAPSRRRPPWPCAIKRDLGVHTEMFTDAVVDLVEAGVITGDAQGTQPGQDRDRVPDGHRAGCTTSWTTTRWSRCARSTSPTTRIDHPLLQRDDGDQLGDRGRPDRPGRGRLDRVADLQRRRRPDGLHPRSGPGRGRAGRSSPCPSTAAGGTVSRIAADPQRGAGVVTTRAHVQTVVTEYGVAELFGKSLRERATALIAIAHPDFRDKLRYDYRRS